MIDAPGARRAPLRTAAAIVPLAGALVVAAVVALAVGAVRVAPRDVIRVLLSAGSSDGLAPELRGAWAIITRIRLPRVVAALAAGVALGGGGAAVQGLFRNPMASPDVLGISAGASLGAVVAIAAGAAIAAPIAIPLAAFAGAIAAALTVYAIATRSGATHLLYVILAGLAISSVLNAAVSAVLMLAEQYAVSQFVFWTMGGLEGAGWARVIPPLPVIVALTAVLGALAPALNVLSLGEEQAHSLGVRVEAVKVVVLLVGATLTAMAISVAGPIAFVGLMVPHLARMIVGPDHRTLIPTASLGGALFLVGADTLARVLIAPREIETGIVTAMVGGPYFIVLIVRAQRAGR